MATTCRTSSGDLLDTICRAHYGHLNGCVEAVLQANPGLASKPQPFAAELLIVLPDLDIPTTEVIQLWG